MGWVTNLGRIQLEDGLKPENKAGTVQLGDKIIMRFYGIKLVRGRISQRQSWPALSHNQFQQELFMSMCHFIHHHHNCYNIQIPLTTINIYPKGMVGNQQWRPGESPHTHFTLKLTYFSTISIRIPSKGKTNFLYLPWRKNQNFNLKRELHLNFNHLTISVQRVPPPIIKALAVNQT